MPPRVVVGLGNPGQKYAGTRHNAGRDFIDHVAKEHQSEFAERRQAEIIRLPAFFGLELERPVIFAKLSCYMNESGPAIQGLCDKEGAKISDVLIIVDEFMIPYGSLRLKPEGSAGGHNGLKSIIAVFGTLAFLRLRVGVGPVPPDTDFADFVLGRFTSAERESFPKLHETMAESMKRVLAGDLEKAMTFINKAHF